jgi:DNA modification methylase
MIDLRHGDCLEVLKTMPENSVDAVVTDPPYGFSFMGKKWDYQLPSIDIWKEVLRVLKPGGHLLAFGGPRTYHRLACGIEDAGFEIRDQIQWLFGSGFPKSLNVSIAIDKQKGLMKARGKAFVTAGAGSREDIQETSGWEKDPGHKSISDEAKQWQGFGTALKPANEPICLARKPLSESTVAKNVLKWGTGGLNIDGCRMPTGRFPSNLILSHSPHCTDEACDMFECPIALLDEQSGDKCGANGGSGGFDWSKSGVNLKKKCQIDKPGGASRFFYCAKVSSKERGGEDNKHPCVKPIKIMTYLCRLITPPNGIILDPFMGSGSTGMAALKEGFSFIGVEKEKEYFEIAEKRIQSVNGL